MHDEVADECKEAWFDGSTYGKVRYRCNHGK